jgi:segregation and condensation protein A
MALNVKLEAFEGPFDLLFHLIEKNQIDIYDIPIAELTDQYISYLQDLDEKELDLASEFLVMAATLLSIKSKMLLPVPKDNQVQLELAVGEDDLDPREELVDKLVEYKKFKDIALILREKEEEQSKIFKRPPEDLSFLWPEGFSISEVTLKDLVMAFSDLMKRKTRENKVHTVLKDPVPLEKKIREVFQVVSRSKAGVFFSRLFDHRRSRVELIVTFLAVLELIKMNRIKAIQERLFGEIVLVYKGDR